jgi:hypothetical protein
LANPRAADRQPEGLIVMTPQQPLSYYTFSACLIKAATNRVLFSDIDLELVGNRRAYSLDELKAKEVEAADILRGVAPTGVCHD